MFTQYNVKNVNEHILIDDGQGIIIDTGSPNSFHDTGQIFLCGDSYTVPRSIMNVNSEYLSKEIGSKIHGLLGMDIISKYPILFELQNGFIFVDDDTQYSSAFSSFILPFHMVCIELCVNGQRVRLIVDTGAKISYIDSSVVKGHDSIGTEQDFSPLFGHFSTNLYKCNVKLLQGESIVLTFGTPPSLLTEFLTTMQVQGIIGIEFFKLFRLQLCGGKLYFPPQGI